MPTYCCTETIEGREITYSTFLSPEVGDNVVYQGKLYRFVSKENRGFKLICGLERKDSEKNTYVCNMDIRNIHKIVKPTGFMDI